MSFASSSKLTLNHTVRSQTLRRITTLPISQLYSRRSASSSTTNTASASASASTSSAIPPPKYKVKAAKRPISSCPAGTKMPGLSILKDQPDPVALPDDQYPDWLWTLSDDPSIPPAKGQKGNVKPGGGKGGGGVVDFKAEKKKLRESNRANIKATNYLKTT